MDTLPIWLFLFWTMGAPLLWILVDHLQRHGTQRQFSDRPLPLRATTPKPDRR